MATKSTDAPKKESSMSNESNRDARNISPSELQASDFFPPGHGWNKDEEPTRKHGSKEEIEDQDESSTPHPRPN